MPETTAADWLVPDPRNRRPSTLACGFSVSAIEPGVRSDRIDLPGATMSTPRAVVPQFEKLETISIFVAEAFNP